MNHEVTFNKTNRVITVLLTDKINADDARAIIKSMDKIFADNGDQLNVLGDLAQVPSFQLDRETRRILQDGAKDYNLGKIAIIGANPTIRMFAKIIVAVLGKNKDSGFFKTEEDALTWLKKEK